MNTLNPRLIHMMFIASVVMIIVSLALSVVNVATVLSAPLATGVTVPNKVGFEGYLTGVSDGAHSLKFTVYDAATAGTVKWTETQTVTVTSGLYAARLGSVTPLTANLFDGDRWIGVVVDGGTEISPRTQVSSVPFALNADSANNLRGATTAGMIALFDTVCPSGWSEVAATRGRVVVGVPAGGTISGTQGTALTNMAQRQVTLTAANIPPHTHSAGTLVTNPAGAHHHQVRDGNGSGTTWTMGFQQTNAASWYEGVGMTNDVPDHTHTITGTTGSTGSGTAVDVTMPYIQLVYCKLNP